MIGARPSSLPYSRTAADGGTPPTCAEALWLLRAGRARYFFSQMLLARFTSVNTRSASISTFTTGDDVCAT